MLCVTIIATLLVVAATGRATPGTLSWFNDQVYPHLKDGSAGGTVGPFTDCPTTHNATRQGVYCADGNDLITHVELGEAALSGTLPSTLGLMTSLVEFDADRNALHGTIPTELGAWTKLISFYLYANSGISGTLPTEIGAWTLIVDFFVSFMPLLGGTLPSELGAWKSTELLSMEGCSFSGTLPTQLASMSRLRIVHLHCNRFSGTVPPQFASAWPQVRNLFLFNNRLVGPLPALSPVLQWCRLMLNGAPQGNSFDCPVASSLSAKCTTESPEEFARPCDSTNIMLVMAPLGNSPMRLDSGRIGARQVGAWRVDAARAGAGLRWRWTAFHFGSGPHEAVRLDDGITTWTYAGGVVPPEGATARSSLLIVAIASGLPGPRNFTIELASTPVSATSTATTAAVTGTDALALPDAATTTAGAIAAQPPAAVGAASPSNGGDGGGFGAAALAAAAGGGGAAAVAIAVLVAAAVALLAAKRRRRRQQQSHQQQQRRDVHATAEMDAPTAAPPSSCGATDGNYAAVGALAAGDAQQSYDSPTTVLCGDDDGGDYDAIGAPLGANYDAVQSALS